MLRATRVAIALLLSAVALAGCAATDEAGGDGPVTVLGAASLTEVLRTVDPGARLSTGGSDQLAFQIEQGAPADVFASASPRHTGALRDSGLVDEPAVFATNRVVVIVPASNPAGIRTIADIARPGVKLVIGEPAVPIGAYTRAALARLGLGAALANVVSEEQDVRAVVAKVALAEADAGLAYLTDVRAAEDRVRAIPVPARAQPVVEYEVAVVSATPRREAAEAYVARLLGEPGRTALAGLGFGLPPAR
jgi:molybdate transport system substrate-binding protein